MQALSLSLSPAGRGDDKSVISSAPAGEEESRAPIAEDKNFSESFEATSPKKEASAEPSLSDTSSETTEILGKNEENTSPISGLAFVEAQNTQNTSPKGEALSVKSISNSLSEAPPPSKDGNTSEIFGVTGKQAADDVSKAIDYKAKTVDDKAKVVDDKTKTIDDKAKVVDVKAKVVVDKTKAIDDKAKAANTAVNTAQIQTAQNDVKTQDQIHPQNDPDAPTESQKNEKAATKATAELNVNLKTIKTGTPNDSAKELPKSDKTLLVSETETAAIVKDPANLVETESIENALKKQVDQKAFGQADFFVGNSDGSIKSNLLQTTSSGAENNFTLTSSLVSPTLPSRFSPNIQMISANNLAAATNFNAVSQAIVVANETAKGVTVQLDPPEMGRVYIDFVFDSDDKVNVVVKSEHPQSHIMLRERSEQFLGFLKESGLENVSLSFEQQGQDSGSGFKEQDAPKPLYLAASAEEPLTFNSPRRSLSNEVQSYDGLDLRL